MRLVRWPLGLAVGLVLLGASLGMAARPSGSERGEVDGGPAAGTEVGDPRSGEWTRRGVAIDLGPDGAPDDAGSRNPFVLSDGALYRMWYGGFDGTHNRILSADSPDGIAWTKRGIVFDVQTPPHDFDSVVGQSGLREGGTYKMWFAGGFWGGGPAGQWARIYYAESADAVTWTIVGVALGLGAPGTWDGAMVHWPYVVADGGGYRMYYVGWDGTPDGTRTRVGLATSADGRTFTRGGPAPILDLGAPGTWDDIWLSTPSVLPGTPWTMYYAGMFMPVTGVPPTPRIGIAASPDGLAWTKDPANPAFVEGPPGGWDDAGVFGEHVLSDAADLRMYYTGSDGAVTRIGLAVLQAPSGGVDCDPDTINLRAHGRWIVCYLEPEGGRNASEIVGVTVRLDSWLGAVIDAQQGFSWDPDGYLVDHDGDGVTERLLKFDRQLLRERLTVGDHVFLIEGTFSDGVSFSVTSETIRVIA